MMGRHHAALAGACALGVGHLAGLAPGELLAAAGVCAGAGMLADLDEPGSSVARMAEPISGAVSWVTARLVGGHRQATHSLPAVGVVWLAAFGLAHLSLAGVPATVVVVALTLSLGVRGILPCPLRPGRLVALVLGTAAALAVAHFIGLGTWVPWALAGGWLAHLAGDVATTGGAPLAWPWHRRFALPVLGHTGSGREQVVGIALLCACGFLAWAPAAAVIAVLRAGGW